jgi:long-chain acyl-CoA synthetase
VRGDNGAVTARPQPHLLIQTLRQHALGRPEQIALVGADECLSYAGLWRRVEELAATLIEMKVARLALRADNGPAWILVDLACLAADIVCVPLPTFFSPGQLAHSLADSGCDAVLSEGVGFTEDAEPFAPLPTLLCSRIAVPTPPALPVGTAKITYTSGSTGQPKGVCLSVSNQQLTATALNQALQHVPMGRHLVTLPLATLLENVAGIYTTLMRGATLVVPGLAALGWQGSSGMDIDALCACLDRHQCASLIILPQMLRAFNRVLASGRWHPPASLQFVAVGGARCAASDIQQAREAGLPVYEGYGLSECGSVVCLNRPGQDRPGSAGRPLDHCQLRTINGQLEVRGNVCLGYLGDAAAPSSNWLATGDLASIDPNGYVWLSGRSKNLLISSFGRNVSPEWPESELLACPEIQQCLVFGDARPYCGALILMAPDVTPEQVDACLEQVNQGLPDYAKLACWQGIGEPFSVANGFLTANGRPRREAILEHYCDLIAACYRQAD